MEKEYKERRMMSLLPVSICPYVGKSIESSLKIALNIFKFL